MIALMGVRPWEVARGGEHDLFAAYNRLDWQYGVRPLIVRLLQEAIDVWAAPLRITTGSWQEEVEAAILASRTFAVFLGPAGLGRTQREEFYAAFERLDPDGDFRILPVFLPGMPKELEHDGLPLFLRRHIPVDLRDGWRSERDFQRLLDGIERRVPAAPTRPGAAKSPYPGPRPFKAHEAARFHGRDGDRSRALDKLRHSRFLAVTGASGVGKSSLLRAGLIPALRRGALPEIERWHVRVIAPGERPTFTLATHLNALRPDQSPQELHRRLTEDPTTLDAEVACAVLDESPATRVLFAIDAAEELVTLCRDDDDRKRFLEAIVHAATVPGGRSVVVLVLRSDFYGQFGDPRLARLLEEHQVLVMPLAVDELRRAIEQPAHDAGLEFEPGLVDAIVADVVSEPWSLPAAQAAMAQLCRQRRGNLLTHRGYHEIGGVAGALGNMAEAAFTRLDRQQQTTARKLLLRLAQPGDSADTRRRAPLLELRGIDGDVDDVVQALVAGRILAAGADPIAGEPWIEVTHEALIRNWTRLREWIDADRLRLSVQQQLTYDAAKWERMGRTADLLYRGAELAEMIDVLDMDALNGRERDLLQASSQGRDRRRRRKRLRPILASSVVAAVVAGVAWSAAQIDAANDGEDRAESVRLAQSALSELEADPQHGLELALKAARRAPTAKAELALRAALGHPPESLALPGGERVAFSPDGKRLVVTRSNRRPRLWKVGSKRRLAVPAGTTGTGGAGFSRSGALIASAGRRAAAMVWTPGARVVATLGPGDQDSATTLSDDPFSPGERRVATGDVAGVTIWDVASGRRLRRLEARRWWLEDARFSPRGDLVAATSIRDGTDSPQLRATEVWSLANGRHQVLPGAQPRFSPDGRHLLTSSPTTVRLWALPSGRAVRTIRAAPDTIAFSRDGRLIVAPTGVAYATSDGRRLRLPEGLRLAPHPSFTPDARFAIANSQLYRLSTGEPLRTYASSLQPLGVQSEIRSPAITPDGRRVLTQVEDELRLVRLTRPRRVVIAPPPRSPDAMQPEPSQLAADGRRWTAVLTASSGALEVWRGSLRSSREGPRLLARPRADRVALSRDGSFAAAVDRSGRSTLWDTSPWRRLSRVDIGAELPVDEVVLPPHVGPSVSLSDDGRRVGYATSRDHGVWSTTRGRRLDRLVDRAARGGDISVSSMGALAVSTSPPRLWATRSGRLVARLGTRSKTIAKATFSPDDRRVATLGEDAVRIWATRSGKLLATLGTQAAGDAAFNADGRLLLTASYADGVDVWEVQTGRHVTKLLERSMSELVVAFADEGRTVLALDGDSVELIPCDPCRPLDELRRLAEHRVEPAG